MTDTYGLRLRINKTGTYLEDTKHGTVINLTNSINLPWSTIEPNGKTDSSVTAKLELELDSIILKPTED